MYRETRHILIPWTGGAFAPLGPFLCPTTEEKIWPIAPQPGPYAPGALLTTKRRAAERGGVELPMVPTLIGQQLDSGEPKLSRFFKLVRAFFKLRALYSTSTCSLVKSSWVCLIKNNDVMGPQLTRLCFVSF
jgi:hypothetical protein